MKDILRNIGLLTASGALFSGALFVTTAYELTPSRAAEPPKITPRTERTDYSYKRIWRDGDFTSLGSYIELRLIPGDDSRRLILIKGRHSEDIYRGLAVARTYCEGTSGFTTNYSHSSIDAILAETNKPDCPKLIPNELPYPSFE